MGVHMMPDVHRLNSNLGPNEDEMVANAILCEDFLLRSLEHIQENDEIIITYDNIKITRPSDKKISPIITEVIDD